MRASLVHLAPGDAGDPHARKDAEERREAEQHHRNEQPPQSAHRSLPGHAPLRDKCLGWAMHGPYGDGESYANQTIEGPCDVMTLAAKGPDGFAAAGTD